MERQTITSMFTISSRSVSVILVLITCLKVVYSSECGSSEFYYNHTDYCHPCHCANSGVCEDYIGCTDNVCTEGWFHPPACQSPTDPLGCPNNFLYYNESSGPDETSECLPCRCIVRSQCGVNGCNDGRCAKGWTNPPVCNKECDDSHFGINCGQECHCKANDTCSKVNGLCTPQGGCHDDWMGAGCQTRLPVLVNPPVITQVGCQTVTLTFNQWNEGKDIGDPEVGQYTLQWQINTTVHTEDSLTWESKVIPKEEETEVYVKTLSNLSQHSSYTFRVIANRTQFGYITRGGVGPESDTVIPVCTEGNTESTTISTTAVVSSSSTSTSTSQPVTTGSSQIGDIQITMAINGDVTVKWAEPQPGVDDITGYRLTHQIVGIGTCDNTYTEPAVSVDLDRSQISYTLSNLEGWRQYSVTIETVRDTENSGQIQTVDFTSKEQEPSASPVNLNHGALGTTSLEFTWKPVPCAERGGVLDYYNVEVVNADASDQPLPVATISVDNESAVVSNLIPYVTYGFRVRMVNWEGTGPFSGYYYRRTDETEPRPPRDVNVEVVSSDSLRVTWLPPDPTHGVIQGYRIQYRVNLNGYVGSTVSQEYTNPTVRTLTGLTANTEYEVQIQASTRVGWGDYTAPVIRRTAEGIPTAPRELMMDYRNTSCLFLYWTVPQKLNGALAMYQVSYKAIRILSGSAVEPGEQYTETVHTEVGLCHLAPAVLYRVGVRAQTGSGVWGEALIKEMWTEVGQPDSPPEPQLVGVRLNYVTIEITPAIPRYGPVSGYFIVAEAQGDKTPNDVRRRRSIPDPTTNILLPGYTAAFLKGENVRSGYIFVLGDEYNYGGYNNKKLQAYTNYSITVVVASSVDGVTKYAYSQLQEPVLTEEAATPRFGRTTSTTSRPSQPPDKTTVASSTTQSGYSNRSKSAVTSSPEKNGPKTTIIVAVVFVIFALILVILLVVWCRWKKGQKRRGGNDKPRYQSSDKDWLNYYSTNFQNNNKNSMKKKAEPWTDTFSLNESHNNTKHQTSSVASVEEVQYSPVDIQVSDIHHNRPEEVPYEEEYRQLPYGQHYMWEVATRPENKDRNRFDHILAYDQSRVILKGKQQQGVGGRGNYINANYIHGYGYDSTKAYIAAQSPFNDKTVYDFWYMVYQENVTQIVFLDRPDESGGSSTGKVTTTRYWPNAGAVKYNDLAVKHIETELYANFLIRRLDIYLEGKTVKHVTQYQYIVWPEHGLPEDPIPLLMFRLKVRMDKGSGGESSPLVAHCETGVSRSAIYIALDSLLEEAKMEHSINVFRFCNQMRHSRVNTIRTIKQYVFLYECLFEALVTNYNLIGDSLKMNYKQLSQVNPVNNKSYFMEQFEVLEKYVHPLTPVDCKASLREGNQSKNRNQSILPPDKYRPVLKNPSAGRGDYINAVYVDSYLSKNAFIVTQNPTEETVVDFWRLVYEQKVSVIVMLSRKDCVLEDCARYWPRESGEEKEERWGSLGVCLVEEFEEEHCTVRTLKVRDTTRSSGQEGEDRQHFREVQHFQFESWKVNEKKPWSRDGFIQLIEAVEDIQDETNTFSHPVVVHCVDGASKSGLYCVCAVVCEVIREEDEVDVFHSIKHLKNRRPQFVNSYEQYKFVFKLLWDYMNTRLEKKALTTSTGDQSNVRGPELTETYTVQAQPHKTHEVCIG